MKKFLMIIGTVLFCNLIILCGNKDVYSEQLDDLNEIKNITAQQIIVMKSTI